MSCGETTIFVVDDDAMVLRGIDRWLRSVGYRVELFTSPQDLLRRARHLGPGCIVLDLRMPGLNGIELQQALTKEQCRLPIVFISGHGDVHATVQAMKAGAVDFLTKPLDGRQLLDAVAAALERDARVRAAKAERDALGARFDALTPRERQVCELVAQGWPNKQIAAELGTVEKTIKVHRGRVMGKLAVRSVAELVRFIDRLQTR